MKELWAGAEVGWTIVVEDAPGLALERLLARDEELLAAGAPAVHVGTFPSAVVSFGVSDHPSSALLRRIEGLGLPVVRRTSGGTALLHLRGDVHWSLVLPRDHPLAGRSFVRNFGPLGEGWRTFLGRRGIEVAWGKAPGLREEYCLLSARGEVLLGSGRALGGASQHATSRALLHHGIVSSCLDRPLLSTLFDLRSSDTERLTSLEELGLPPGPIDLPALARDIGRAVGDPLATLKRSERVGGSPGDDKRVSGAGPSGPLG